MTPRLNKTCEFSEWTSKSVTCSNAANQRTVTCLKHVQPAATVLSRLLRCKQMVAPPGLICSLMAEDLSMPYVSHLSICRFTQTPLPVLTAWLETDAVNRIIDAHVASLSPPIGWILNAVALKSRSACGAMFVVEVNHGPILYETRGQAVPVTGIACPACVGHAFPVKRWPRG